LGERQKPLSLAELIDLESQLAADRVLDRQTLRERDEALAPQVLAETAVGLSPGRHEVFRRWLAALHPAGEISPGERVQAIYRIVAAVLAVLAFLSGSATAAALLRYDGSQPVNIVHFLAVFVVGQLGLALLPVLHMLPRGWLRWVPGFGPLHETLRHLGYRQAGLERVLSRLDSDRGRVATSLARLRSWSTLYADVERWRLLALTQRGAVCFNLGALACCVYLIAVTDLAFAWSTTLSVTTDTMAHLLRALALPWWWLPVAVPSPELVETSRYFRQEGVYDPVVLKDWWAFLVAALAVYGLLPRLLLWSVAGWRWRAAARDLRLDHGDCQAVYERLCTALGGWQADARNGGPDDVGAAATALAARPELPKAGHATGCVVLCWGDVPLREDEAAELVRRRFGWRTTSVQAVGGTQSGGQHTMLESLAAGAASDPVIVVAEAWEAPGKAIRRFLTEIRGAIDVHRPIVVGLVGADDGRWVTPVAGDRDLWERVAALAGDPYLRVEALVET
jgi:hypothetical protein